MKEGIIDGKMHKIGSLPVFTYEGAIDAFRTFAKRCYTNLTMESSFVLTDVADQMLALGFAPDFLENIENEECAKLHG